MNEQEGSKAMTIYIVACFVLAMVALVGYKLKNDQRDELATEYVDLANKFADISAAYAPNVNDYYRKVANGDLTPTDEETRANTRITLRDKAKDIGIHEEDGRLVINVRDTERYRMYMEYSAVVQLDRVTQGEWSAFLSQGQHATRDYAHVSRIDIQRQVNRVTGLTVVDNTRSDRSLWKVTITFVWFGPKSE